MMIQAFQQLKPRERLAVAFAVAALLLYIFYAFIYSPLHTAVIAKEQEYSEKTQTLRLMKNVQRMGANNQKKEVVSNTQLLALMTVEFKKPAFQGFPYQIQQTGTGDIQVGFNQVPYEVMIPWLWTLTTHYVIDLKQVTIAAQPVAGLVECHVTLAVK